MNPPTTDLLTPSPYDQPSAFSASENSSRSALAAVGGGMQAAEVMELLQAMRDEQRNSLKSITDGVQQLQTQVLLLSEVTSASEEKTSLCLERLAGVERRVGSIPVPINPPTGYSSQQANRGWGSSGAPAKVNTDSAPVTSPSPPARGAPHQKPSWMDRSAEQEESSRPHFMRASSSTSQTHASATVPSPSPAPPLGTAVGGGEPADAAALSAEEVAKEAKRRAFEEDRARIQARIAATKAAAAAGPSSSSGSGKSKFSSNGVPPSPSSSLSPATLPSQRGQTHPAPVSSAVAASLSRTAEGGYGGAGTGAGAFGVRPSASAASSPVSAPAAASGPAFSGGPGGAFSSSPYFLSGASVVGGAVEEDDEASRLAKEISAREEAERREKERQERERQEAALREARRKAEEERLEREMEEARRRREQEEARKARELAEARLKEEARRKAEARRQAKTRDIMSSLFDKEEPDDGSSLFKGLGAAVPAGSSVFSEAKGPIPSKGAGFRVSAGASSATPLSTPGGSLFSGVPEIGHGGGGEEHEEGRAGPASSGSLFGDVKERASPKKSLFSSEISSGAGGSLFDRTPAPLAPATFSGRSLLDVSGPVAGKAGSGVDGKKAGGSDDFIGQKKGVFGDDHPSAVTAIGSFTSGKGLFGDADRLGSADDFLSSPPSYGSRPSVSATGSVSPSVRKVDPSKRFPKPTSEAAYDEDVDDIFAPVAGSSGTGHRLAAGEDALGGMSSSTKQPVGDAGRGSLFDRPEFSIDSGDEDGSNVFGGPGPSGGIDQEAVGDVSSSFLTALGDAELSLDDDGGSTKAEGLGISGRDQNMVDVSL